MCSCKNKKLISTIMVEYIGDSTSQLQINGRSYGAVVNGQTIKIRKDDFVSELMVEI